MTRLWSHSSCFTMILWSLILIVGWFFSLRTRWINKFFPCLFAPTCLFIWFSCFFRNVEEFAHAHTMILGKLSTGLADASLDLTCHLAKTWSNLSPIASFFKKKIYISISKKINNLLNIQNKLESCLKFTYVDYHTRICHECKKTRNGIAMFFP